MDKLVPIDAEVIDLIDNPKLTIISQSTGLNHINYNKKKYRYVKILSLKTIITFKSIPSTAEHTFASPFALKTFLEVFKM